MKRLLISLVAAIALSGCAVVDHLSSARRSGNPYETPPFYAKYLDTGSVLDANIQATLEALRRNPQSAELHNQLGSLLVEKRFPKDAAREFERAIDVDRRFHPAWYNLALVRASLGDEFGARRALNRTIALKPGHSAALFQLGLIEEKRQHIGRAVELYAKAFRINPALLEVDVNPRILDTRLTHRALLHAYPVEHARESMQLQAVPIALDVAPMPAPVAPSPQAAPAQIVPPAPPATAPPVSVAPAAPAEEPARMSRRERARAAAEARRLREEQRKEAEEQQETPPPPPPQR